MAKIFSDIVREKVDALLTQKLGVLYEYISKHDSTKEIEHQEERENSKPGRKLFVEVRKEELAYIFLCILEEISSINAVTALHSIHFPLIMSNVKERFEDTVKLHTSGIHVIDSITKRYCFVASNVILEFIKVLNFQFWKQINTTINVQHIDRHFYFYFPKDEINEEVLAVFEDLYFSTTKNSTLKAIERYITEDVANQRLITLKQAKAKETISIKGILDTISKEDKDNISVIYDFLSSVLSNNIHDEQIYSRWSRALTNRKDEIKKTVTLSAQNVNFNGNVDNVRISENE